MFLLILLLPPLAVYLMLLGWINRRGRAVLMAGTWEFAGVLFALSGFLLFGGPAFLGGFDEQSRWFWLLGQKPDAAGGDNGAVWMAARVAYFLLVAGAAAFFLWRGRRLTSVYNVDSRSIFTAIEQAFGRLGLDASRTGDSYAIGGPKAAPETVLNVDIFPLMRHATLRWRPADSPLRRGIERELALALSDAAPPDPDAALGGCLSVLGVTLFTATFIAAALLLLFRYFPSR